MEETQDTLETFVRQGWVRYIGMSNFAAWQMAKAVTLQRCRAAEPFVSALQDLGLGLIVWSPLSGGFLSGKYQRGTDLPEARIRDLRASSPRSMSRWG